MFSEICDGQMLELTQNYRAENDVDFKEFITDLKIVKYEGKPDFKTYGTTKCRKSLCWTNLEKLENPLIINGCKKKQKTKNILLSIIIKHL